MFWLAAGIAGLAIMVTPALAQNSYVTAVFTAAVMYGVLGAIFDLMIGFLGLSNFGFAGFIAVGAYVSALGADHFGISPWVGLLSGGLACAVVGIFTGAITLRLRGLYLGMATWFVAEAIRFTISNTPEYTRGAMGLAVDPFPGFWGIQFGGSGSLPNYYLLLALAALVMGSMQALVRSRIGLAFKAIREDQIATESLGLSSTKYKLINLTIACFFTGVVGAFYAHTIGILTPSPEQFGVVKTVEILTIAYVGGRGTLWGSIAAGFLLIGFQEVFRDLGNARLVMYGALLIVVMLYMPKGLSGLKKYFD
jgi:branched-chain amino acid transport system permease protein